MDKKQILSKLHLNKTLGGFDLFCIATGAMISSGIFILPGLAFKEIGPAVFLSYGIAGLAAMFGSLAVIELSTAMPKAGGTYYFIERSLGPGVGTVSGILSWLALILKSSFAAYGLGAVFQEMFGWDLVLTASATTVFFLIVNLIGTKEAAVLENLMVIGLLLIMFGYVACAVPHAQPARMRPFFYEGNSIQMLFSVAALVFVSFGGLLKVSSVSEEVKVPRRSIPAGLLTSIAVVTVLYMLVLVATTVILPAEEFSKSLTPLADAAKQYYGTWGYVLVTVAALLAFITTVNAGVMAASRYPIAMGRDELLPKVLARTSGKNNTPVIAVAVTGALMLIALQIPLEMLVKAASAVIMASYVLINIAVIVLRESHIQNYRPTFRSPWYPYLQIGCIIGFTALIVNMGGEVIELCLGIVLVALLVFFFCGRKVRREYAVLHLVERITSRQLTDHHLEGELREVIRHRDEIEGDDFDAVVEKAQVAIYDSELSLKELLDKAATELAPVLQMEQSEILSLLLEREQESSTVLAPGVALPHLVVPGTGKFHLLIVKSSKGVQFEEDDEKVNAIFVLAGSRDRRNLHLRSLAALAQIISDHAFETNWRKLNTPEQLRDAILLGTRRR